jgi:hypothetical protein
MVSKVSKDFNYRGSGHTAAIRTSVVVLVSFIILASLICSLSG